MEQITMRLQQKYVEITSALKREEGQDFAEYALIFALVVLIAATAFSGLGTAIGTKVGEVTTLL